MRLFYVCLLAVSFTTQFAAAEERQDEIFDAWAAAQRNVKSLVVEFTLETIDSVFHERKQADGTLRLIRTDKGEILASYGLKGENTTGLFNDGAIYLLFHDTQTAFRLRPQDGDVRRFLQQHFNPFILVLNRKLADETCKIEIARQDQQYTYLKVISDQPERHGWLPGIDFALGWVLLENQTTDDVPQNMPRKLYHTDRRGRLESFYHIKAWRMNVTDAPRPEEFTRPEDRPDWKLVRLNETKQ